MRTLAKWIGQDSALLAPDAMTFGKMMSIRPSPLLTHEKRMEVWRERNAEAEFWCWCALGLMIVLGFIMRRR